MKGLICKILEDKDGVNCSNGGISNRVGEVLLVGPDIPEVFHETAYRPAVKLEKRFICGRWHTSAVPVEPPPAGTTGYMMGGTFIWACDSRFPEASPIPLHDRTETWEEYRHLSI